MPDMSRGRLAGPVPSVRTTFNAAPSEALPGPAARPRGRRLLALGAGILRSRPAGQPPPAADRQQDTAATFLSLLGDALRGGQACLNVSPAGAVLPPDVAALCGWTASADGVLQPAGLCIGYVTADPAQDRRVYMWPPNAYAAAGAAAARNCDPLPFSLPQVRKALRDAGLISRGGQLDAYGTLSFWNMAASTVLTPAPGRLPALRQAAGP